MTERGRVIVVTAALCVLAGIWGFQSGRPVTDTDILNQIAADYVKATGPAAKLTDCAATPGDGRAVRMIVMCGTSALGTTVIEVSLEGRWARTDLADGT